jgi:hypothetical protein
MEKSRIDENAVKLVAQRIRGVNVEQVRRLLELMINADYGGRRAAEAVLGSKTKKDKALAVKRTYLEIVKPLQEADEELERLKKELTEVEDQRRRKEAAEKLEAEKLRMLKAILRGKIELGGKKLILETLKADTPLYKRFSAYCELKDLTSEYALSHLGCTTTNLLEDVEFCTTIEPWQKALLDSIEYLLDDELPSMRTLEARLYMRDHFPSTCPECSSSIEYISSATLKGERVFFIGCLSTKHQFIRWLVKCPICGSWMKVKTIAQGYILKSLVCPKCKEIWRKGRYRFWPKEYCVRVFPQRVQEAEKKVKKEKHEELSSRPWTPSRNFFRFIPNDKITEICRPVSEEIIDRRVLFYIRMLIAAGVAEINFREAAKKLGLHPNQVFCSWKRLRNKGLIW